MNNSNITFFKTLYNHNGNKFSLVNFVINSKIKIKLLNICIYGSDNFKYDIQVNINNLNDHYIGSFVAKKGISYFIKIDINNNTNIHEEITKFYKINDDYEISNNETNNIEMIVSKLNNNINENSESNNEYNSNSSDIESDNDNDNDNEENNKNIEQCNLNSLKYLNLMKKSLDINSVNSDESNNSNNSDDSDDSNDSDNSNDSDDSNCSNCSNCSKKEENNKLLN